MPLIYPLWMKFFLVLIDFHPIIISSLLFVSSACLFCPLSKSLDAWGLRLYFDIGYGTLAPAIRAFYAL